MIDGYFIFNVLVKTKGGQFYVGSTNFEGKFCCSMRHSGLETTDLSLVYNYSLELS